MSKKIIALALALLAALGGWLLYIRPLAPTLPAAKSYPGKIIIGTTPWPGYLGLYVADEKNFFGERGLNVEIRDYAALAELSKEYSSGAIHGRANLTLEAVSEAARGLDHKVVAAIDYSSGSDGIIAAKKIKKISELKGRRVAFEHGSLEEFFLIHALDTVGLAIGDIIPLDLNPEEAARAMAAGKADVAVTYEPFMSQALKESGGNKIYSSADAPGLITDILTFRSDFIHANPEAVQAIIDALFKAVEFWKENPGEASVILAKRLKTAPDQIPAQLEGIIVLGRDENRIAFTFALGPQSLYGNMRNTGEFVERRLPKIGIRKVDTDALIEAAFVRRALR